MLRAHAISRKDETPADGIHLLWAPPATAGYSVDGFDVWRRESKQDSEPVCHRLTLTELDELHQRMRLSTPAAEIAFRISPQSDSPVGPHDFRVYTFDFGEPRSWIQVELFAPAVLAVAFRGPKAAAVESFDPAQPSASFAFRDRGADRVVVYAVHEAESLVVCREDVLAPADEEGEWQGADLIAQGLQLPFREVQPSLSSVGDEIQLALARLLPGEDLGNGDFKTLSEVMNEALKEADVAPPTVQSRRTRDDLADPFVELSPWGYGLGLTVDAMWRRAFGFGLLDRGSELVPDASYDYRIVGTFRRRDLEERLLGFHTVPGGTRLPSGFHLGPVRLTSEPAPVVEIFPENAPDVLQHQGRKGIAVDGGLTLDFPEPVTRAVLEFEPAASHLMEYKVETTGLIPGLPVGSESGPVPATSRVELTFSEPVDRVELVGRAFFYGLRLPSTAAGEDPFETVKKSVAVLGVRYEKTPPPEPPSYLTTENLQQAFPSPGGAPSAPHGLGYRLSWQPPGTPLFWPEDLEAAPPFDEMAFELERRRSDKGGPYGPFDTESPVARPTLIGGNRGSAATSEFVSYGADLLELFPEVRLPAPPVPTEMELEDVLRSDARPAGPEPGSEHQYRIFSLDLTGRRSATPTEGPPVKLEKRQPPPLPVGPPPPPDPELLRPVGVHARVLQAEDPHLTAADQALLGTSDSAVVLEWGWTQEERRKDPWAREFRIYWQSTPPDLLLGSLTGTAVWDGNHFRMQAELGRAVAADELAGAYVETSDVGGRAFRIASNDAASAVELRLEKSPVDEDAVPAAGGFVLAPRLDGSELRPAAWEERVAVQPITAAEGYSFVFRDRLSLSAEAPRARVWVGVSAADAESYVADGVPAGAPNGGRPGNESSVVAAAAEARYLGRPDFAPPPPLADVPETVLPEVDGEALAFELDLAALLPALAVPPGRRFLVERLSAADLVSRISATESDEIRVRLFDGTTPVYQLANPDDHAAFLAAIRSGQPARIANKFLMDLAIRFPTELDTLWQRLGDETGVPLAPLAETVANKAERHLYRLRRVDAAGHTSVATALVPRLFRVPSRRLPGVPEVLSVTPEDDRVKVRLGTEDSFDLTGVLVFSIDGDAAEALGDARIQPRLLRVPGRPDLYPENGIRLRLASGAFVAPQFLDRTSATAAGGRLTYEADLIVGSFRRVAVWAVAVTRDGVPSLVAGPQEVVTPEAPAAVPPLTLGTAAGADQASWPAEPGAVDVSVERSVDGGDTWKRLTPWLSAAAAGQRDFPSPAGDRLYRLVTRNRGGRRSTGAGGALP